MVITAPPSVPPAKAIPIASPRRAVNQLAITIEQGITVDAPTQIPNSPLIARISPKLVARLSTRYARPVTVAPTIIIFFGLTRSAIHPISGPAAPPVTHPIENATDSLVRDHPKYLMMGTKKTTPELIAPQIKNIVRKIAPTIIHPRRSCSVATLTTEAPPQIRVTPRR